MLNTVEKFDLGNLYTSFNIQATFPKMFNSYLYYTDLDLLNYLKSLYVNTITKLDENFTQQPTYLYMSNLHNVSVASGLYDLRSSGVKLGSNITFYEGSIPMHTMVQMMASGRY